MDKRINPSGEALESVLGPVEAPMETADIHVTNKAASTNLCAHSRMIDDVRTRSKKRAGKVRCLECGAIIEDPYDDPCHGLK